MAFVEQLKDRAHARLVVGSEKASLSEVARLLHAGTDIVVICDAAGALAGIVTKTDLVEQLTSPSRLDDNAVAGSVMKRDVVTCRPDDELHALWSLMHARDLKNLPVIDSQGRPSGILNARDALEVLLAETEDGEALLRDYVMGIGYR